MLFHIENLSQNLGLSVINIRPGLASKVKGGCELSERRNVKSISSQSRVYVPVPECFKMVLPGRCQIMCSGCGWAMQRLMEIGINYSVSEKRVYSDRKKFCIAGENRQTQQGRIIQYERPLQKSVATNIRHDQKFNCKKDRDIVAADGRREREGVCV